MASKLLLDLAPLATLVPASALALRRRGAAEASLFWWLFAVATVGSLAWVLGQLGGSWRGGFSAALWVTIAATLVAFGAVALVARPARDLAPLLMPYLTVLGILATVWSQVPASGADYSAAPAGWFATHIAVSVATYALTTLAATAGCAVMLRERALKSRKPAGFTQGLPSIADAERLEFRLLAAGVAILALGLLTGMAITQLELGTPLTWNHKTLFSLLAFVTLGGLLVAHRTSGVRGRGATRWVLAGYLLLTLAYPGVKFVHDVLIGA